MKMWTKHKLLGMAILTSLVMTGCLSMKLNVPDYSDPLKEVTLEGEGPDKVLVIPINGFISDEEQEEHSDAYYELFDFLTNSTLPGDKPSEKLQSALRWIAKFEENKQ